MMKVTRTKQSGFSAVELLITLFIAGIFLTTGYQLYGLVTRDSGESRLRVIASREVENYITSNKIKAKDPCSAQTAYSGTPTVDGLGTTAVTVTIDCPYASATSVSRITGIITYGTPQQTVTNVSYIKAACPDGFISVPGSSTYGTNDFCVMKYEAKNNGAGVAVSTESGTPWTSITQPAATTTAAAACTGCHIITEAEWMTIAQNVLSVASNWSGGTVGNGCIARGNNGTNDACGYDGTDPEFGSGRNSKASLMLTNGQVIWDLAGNVWEWTSGQNSGGAPGVAGAGSASREWTACTSHGSLPIDPFPSTTNITGSSGWTSATNGIGTALTNADATALTGLHRGGDWISSGAGVLTLAIDVAPTYSGSNVGFRVAR